MLVPQSCEDESQSDVDLETTFKKRKKFHSVSTFRKYAYSFSPLISAHNYPLLCPRKLIFFSKFCSFKEFSDCLLSNNLVKGSLQTFMYYF